LEKNEKAMKDSAMIKIPEIAAFAEQFGNSFERSVTMSQKRAVLTVRPEQITEMAGFLFKELQFRFIIASALETDEGIEILYHFSFDATGLVLSLRVVLDRAKPEIESLTVLFDAANWIEREMHELLGINFLHHPNLEKLISEGNWAEGVYPFRRDQGKEQEIQ